MSVPAGHCDLIKEAAAPISAALKGANGWVLLCFAVRSGKELEMDSVAMVVVKSGGCVKSQ